MSRLRCENRPCRDVKRENNAGPENHAAPPYPEGDEKRSAPLFSKAFAGYGISRNARIKAGKNEA